MTPLAASVRVAGPATRRSHDGRALAALRLGTSFLRRSVHDLSSCRPAGLSSTGRHSEEVNPSFGLSTDSTETAFSVSPAKGPDVAIIDITKSSPQDGEALASLASFSF